jgi:hypothetical protein
MAVIVGEASGTTLCLSLETCPRPGSPLDSLGPGYPVPWLISVAFIPASEALTKPGSADNVMDAALERFDGNAYCGAIRTARM